MLITCPNCQTHYSVSAQNMGDARDVRCHNCGNTWRQASVPERPRPRPAHSQPAFTPPWLGQPQAAAPPPPPPYGYPPQQPPPPQGGYPPQPPPPQGGYPPQPQGGYPPYPPQQAAPPPPPEPAPAQGGRVDTDSLVAELRQEAEDDEADGASSASDAPAEDLSDDDFEDMFGEADDFEPISSVIDAEGEAVEVEDPDEIPDPDDEDFPVSLTADLAADMEPPEPSQGGPLKWILVALIVLILVVGGGGFLFKSMVMEMFPGARSIYEAVGLGENMEEVFEFGPIMPDRVTEAGVDYLVIKGSLTNISNGMRVTPRIRVNLLSADGDNLQFSDVDPEPVELRPGETAEFEARIKEPSPLARRMEATFTERMTE
ncbi:MAG: MJ0042-type zinc finger domain-containing protein [Rhodospirillales bacterium]